MARYLLVLWVLAITGCGAIPPINRSRAATVPRGTAQSDLEMCQSAASEFSGRFITSMADVYDRVYETAISPQAALMARRAKLQAAHGVLGAAANPNPIAAMMDMAVLVTLIHESSKDPLATELFGPQAVAMMGEVLARHEDEIWKLISRQLTAPQVAELREVIATWRRENPGQRYVAGVRLAQLPQASRPGSLGDSIAQSIFSIIRLDPFAGLDPAIREVEESRALAERMFSYARHLPSLTAWQAEASVLQMLATPQATQVLANADQFSNSTKGFVEASDKFARATRDTAATIEQFRAQLPVQQATLIDQLNELVARQREDALTQAFCEIASQREALIIDSSKQLAIRGEALLKQAGDQVTAEREAAIKQLDAAITAQQSLLATSIDRFSTDAIDHLFRRGLTLVLVAAASGAALIILHRVLRPRAA